MIAVADYGLGNLRSVQKAFEFMGFECVVTDDTGILSAADGLVLPGVGAFETAMQNLSARGMTEFVREWVLADRPFLGICLGFQMLFDYSEEGACEVEGLGLFHGSVKRFSADIGLKIPQIGWNSLEIKEDVPLFRDINNGAYVYFVHSYYGLAENRNETAAVTEYGLEFDSAINRGNVFATQFHPEKSGDIGLKMIRNFGELAHSYRKEGGKKC